MIVLLLAVAFAQEPAWRVAPIGATVGDTVRIERVIPAAPGATGRTQAIAETEWIEPLTDPELAGRAGGLLVRHRVAFFAPGVHRVAMPAVEVVAADGHVEMVVGDTAIVTIVSVLPDTSDRPEPQWSRPPIERTMRRPEPPVLLGGGVLAAMLLWGIARRRTRPRPQRPTPPVDDEDSPVMRWLSAGETRAVTTLSMDRLRARIAASIPEATRALDTAQCIAVVRRERPEWPLTEIEGLLHALDRSRFAPLGPSDAAELADRMEELLPRLRVESAS